MIIGSSMVAVHAYVYRHPGCSKRAAAIFATKGKGLSTGYRSVDSAIRAGLIYARATTDERWELTAVAPDDIPNTTYDGLCRWYERHGPGLPPDLRRTGKARSAQDKGADRGQR